MAGTLTIALEAAFFVISVFATVLAIYELRRARNTLSDELLKKSITWMMYSSFILAILSAGIAINFLVTIAPDLKLLTEEVNLVTFLNILIWAAIACNIMVALKVREIGETFGFKESKEKDLLGGILKKK